MNIFFKRRKEKHLTNIFFQHISPPIWTGHVSICKSRLGPWSPLQDTTATTPLSLSTRVRLFLSPPQVAPTRFVRTRAPLRSPTLSPSRPETLAARKLFAPLPSPRRTRRAGRAGRHGRGELLEVRRRAAAAAGDGGRRGRRGWDGTRGDGHRVPDGRGTGGGNEPAGGRRRHGAAGRRAASQARAPRLRRFVPPQLFYLTAPLVPLRSPCRPCPVEFGGRILVCS